MSDFNQGYSRPVPGTADMSVDAGLRAFMLGVYNKMALGLVLSAGLAWLTGTYPPVRDLMFRVSDNHIGFTLLGMVVAFAPLAVILFGLGARTSPRASGIVYWTIVALIGASLGTVVLLYTGAAIANAFLVTAIAFGGLSLVGYTTKRDLTGFRSFLIMGLFGLLGAMVVSLFFPTPMMGLLISIFGVLIFAGLIAANTQQLKMTYYSLGGDQAALGAASNFGALQLYLNFVNLFRFVLMLMGGRR